MNTKIILVFVLPALAIAFCRADVSAQMKKPKKIVKQKIQTSETPGKYTVDAEMFAELRDKISIVESKQDWAKFNRQRPVVNADRTRSAYIAAFKIEGDAENLRDVIVVRDARADKFYEIRGLDFPRPFENLVWQSNDVLVFDQRLSPRRGGRYAVNLQTGKLVGFGFVE